jgi:glutamate dehydrogenase
MPFLVDSVTAELTGQGRSIHLVVHPQLVVRRDITGRLLDVCPVDGEASEGAFVESWMHVEVDRESETDDLDRIAAALDRVLRDVREAVEDWPKMRQQALRIAAQLRDARPDALPEAEVEEARELLGWLADDHFTFLATAGEYQLVTDDDGDLLQAVPGSGLGILRCDQSSAA